MSIYSLQLQMKYCTINIKIFKRKNIINILTKTMCNQSERLHVKELIKLKQQEVVIEKSLEYFFNNMKTDSNIIKNVIHECKDLLDERNRIESLLRNKVFDIDSGFDTIKCTVNQLHNGQSIDIDNCQKIMKNLLEKIEEFNVESELELLKKQQTNLDNTLNEFKMNLSKYNNIKNSAERIRLSKLASSIDEIDQDIENYEKINNFHTLVVKTGHTQHWEEKDHMYFINVRKKCPNIPAMVIEIQKRCPDLSAENIVNHEAWYKVYLNLREKQRKSINQWRERKESEKHKKVLAMKNIKVNKYEPENTEMSHKQKNDNEEILIGTNNKISKVISPFKKTIEDINEQKEIIKQWRIERANAKIADEKQLEHQREAMKARKEKQFSIRAIKIRDAVAKYKEEKNEMKLELLSRINLKNNKIIKSHALIMSLRKKDEDFLNKRKKNIEMKYQRSTTINETVNENCPRPIDQSTLMKPTKIWTEKCKRRISTEQSYKPLLYIKDLPKLSVNNVKNQTSILLN